MLPTLTSPYGGYHTWWTDRRPLQQGGQTVRAPPQSTWLSAAS